MMDVHLVYQESPLTSSGLICFICKRNRGFYLLGITRMYIYVCVYDT